MFNDSSDTSAALISVRELVPPLFSQAADNETGFSVAVGTPSTVPINRLGCLQRDSASGLMHRKPPKEKKSLNMAELRSREFVVLVAFEFAQLKSVNESSRPISFGRRGYLDMDTAHLVVGEQFPGEESARLARAEIEYGWTPHDAKIRRAVALFSEEVDANY